MIFSRGSVSMFCVVTCYMLTLVACSPADTSQEVEENLFHWHCDAESILGNGTMPAKGEPEIQFKGGKMRVDSLAHSGSFSVLADTLSPYSMSIKIEDVQPGDVFEISIYIHSSSGEGRLVAANNAFWKHAEPLGDKDPDGWEKLELAFTIPANSTEGSFKVYGWNNGKGEVLFDDLIIDKLNSKLPSDFGMSSMYIYISDPDMLKLNGKVIEALDKGVLVKSDDSWVKALIFCEEQMMEAKIRLKGDWTDHLQGVKWSFRVKLKGNHSWKGMRTFSVQNPASRSFLDEWLSHKIFAAEGVLTPRYGFVPVQLNGRSLGLYAYEEHFEKQLVESQQRREGPIIRLGETQFWEANLHDDADDCPVQASAVIEPFGVNDILRDSLLFSQFLVSQKLLYDYQTFASDVHGIFDADKMARHCALTDLCSFSHGMNWHNQRFYYNPIISRLEPIAYDGNVTFLIRVEPNDVLEGHIDPENLFNGWQPNVFVKRLFADEDFMASYIHYLRAYSEPTFLEEILQSLESELADLEKMIQIEEPDYFFDRSKFLTKARSIGESIDDLSPDLYGALRGKRIEEVNYPRTNYYATTPKFFVNPYMSLNGGLKVFNFYQDSVQLIGVTGQGSLPRLLAEAVGMRPYSGTAVDMTELDIACEPGDKLVFKVVGQKELHEREIIPWPHPEEFVLERLAYNVPREFFQERDSLLILEKGDYSISESIVIPPGHRVLIKAGVRIDFIEESTLLSYSPVDVQGTLESPVEMTSSDETGFGLNILQAEGLSTISHLKYADISAFKFGNWSLSGALNIYDSDIEIEYLHVRENHCEDALNIICSDFQVSNSTFENIFADAFDSDFSTGTLRSTEFKEVVNDAIDFSGSEVEIIDCKMESIGDKGISGGEGSSLFISGCTVSKAYIGIASKDQSMIELRDSKLSSCEYGLVVFQKKPEYGPAEIKAERLEWSGLNRTLLIEEGSTIELNGKLIEGKKKNVANLFY